MIAQVVFDNSLVGHSDIWKSGENDSEMMILFELFIERLSRQFIFTVRN